MIKEYLKTNKISSLLILVLLVYGFHFIIRVFSFENFGDSDGREALILDALRVGYTSNGGPLYTWLMHFMVAIFGFNVASFLLLKYALVASIYLLFYYIYGLFSRSKQWAFIASLSLGSCYFMIWRLHEVMTQRLLTTSIGLAIVFCYFYFYKSRIGFWESLLLGVLVGLGLLTESYIVIIVGALFITTMFYGGSWRSVGAITVLISALICASPFYNWLIVSDQFFAFFIGVHDLDMYEASVWSALRSAVLHPLYVISPALFLFSPFLLSKSWGQSSSNGSLLDRGVFVKYLLCAYGLWLCFYGFLFPSRNSEVQTALSVFLPVLILLFLELETRIQKTFKVFVILSIFPIVSIFFRVGNLLILEPFCRNCRWAIPYEGLANSIGDCASNTGQLNIYSRNVDILANLKRYHPNFIYKQIENPEFVQVNEVGGNYLLIEDFVEASHANIRPKANQAFVEVNWKQPYLGASNRSQRISKWYVTAGSNVDPYCVKFRNIPQ